MTRQASYEAWQELVCIVAEKQCIIMSFSLDLEVCGVYTWKSGSGRASHHTQLLSVPP